MALTAIALSLAAPDIAAAQDLQLSLPVDCQLGKDYYIQQYMDHDPGRGFRDFHCRGLSYDGHKGTDFAVPTLRDMDAGVDVIAAAPGTVRGFRDGMTDDGFTESNADRIEGRECGNGVVLVHPGGWETQYCHLKRGTVTVRNGQSIKRGQVLGQIGLSGRSEFPHLHLSVRKDGKPVDPFDPDGTLSCNTPGDSTLWRRTPAYQPGGLIDVGVADEVPEYRDVKAGIAADTQLDSKAEALVIFGFAFGTLKDDVMRLTLTGPEGNVVSEQSVLTRNHAQAFRAVGRRLRDNRGWPPGPYAGKAELLRGGQVIDQRTVVITISRAD